MEEMGFGGLFVGFFLVILPPKGRLPHSAPRHTAQRQLKPGPSENQRSPHLVLLRVASMFRSPGVRYSEPLGCFTTAQGFGVPHPWAWESGHSPYRATSREMALIACMR